MNLSAVQPAHLGWLAATVFAAIALSTVYRLASFRSMTSELARKRLGSLLSWWGVAICVFAAGLGGQAIAALLFFCVAAAALHEYGQLARPEPLDRISLLLGCAMIAALAAGLAAGFGLTWLLSVPLATSIAVGILSMARHHRIDFTAINANLLYGIVLIACLPGTCLLLLDTTHVSSAQASGMFLLVIGLTQWNDIVSAWTGRAIGGRRLAPQLSPNKTQAGVVGGLIGTVLIAALVAPSLSPLDPLQSAVLGLLIAVAGTLGDLNMSAIKRGAGVKDSGRLLPGQGGILDRIDSLTFSAPASYCLLEATRWMTP